MRSCCTRRAARLTSHKPTNTPSLAPSLPNLLPPNSNRRPRGRCTYTAGLDAEGQALEFGPAGDSYALLCPNTLTLHAASGAGGLLARVDSEVVKFTALGRGRQDDRWARGVTKC